MSTLTAPTPTVETSPALTQLLTAPAAGLAPVVELARQCCALLRRPCYDWKQATVTPSYDRWQEVTGNEPDQFITVMAPSRLPGLSDFMLELVQEAHSGHWRLVYAYATQLIELSPSQQAQASALLGEHTGSGEIKPYWK